MAPTPERKEKSGRDEIDEKRGTERPESTLAVPSDNPSGDTAARSAEAETAADALTLDAKIKEEEFKAERKRIEKAKNDIERTFERKRLDTGTVRSEMEEDYFLTCLYFPLNVVDFEWKKAIERAHASGKTLNQFNRNLAEEFDERINEAVQTAIQYIERMTQETGWITPEKLAEMTGSMSKKADIFGKLMAERGPEIEELQEAFKAAIGLQGKYGSNSEARLAAISILPKWIEREFANSDNGLMPCVWGILAFMTREERLTVTREYIKNRNEQETEKFLSAGNRLGIFGFSDMETIMQEKTGRKDFKYADKEREIFTQQFQAANAFTAQAEILTRNPYGSTTDAERMLSLKGVGKFFLGFCAGLTIVGNTVATIFYGGKLKLDTNTLGRLVTNHNILGASAVLGGLHLASSKERMGQIFETSQEKKTRAHAQAVKALAGKFQEASWPDWDQFFKNSGFGGARAFAEYTNEMTVLFEGERPKSRFTPEGFLAYLDEKIKSGKSGEERNLDYAEIKKAFIALAPQEIASYGDIFANFEQADNFLGRGDTEATYNELLDEARKV